MAHSVKYLTLDFCPGYDLTVPEIKPCTGPCGDSVEPAWDFLSFFLFFLFSLSLSFSFTLLPSLSLPSSCALLSLKIHK